MDCNRKRSGYRTKGTIQRKLPHYHEIAQSLKAILTGGSKDTHCYGQVKGRSLLSDIGRSQVHGYPLARYAGINGLEGSGYPLLALPDGTVRQTYQIKTDTLGNIYLYHDCNSINTNTGSTVSTTKHIFFTKVTQQQCR